MRILYAKDYEGMSFNAAKVLASVVINKPGCVLGLATGSSPIGMYKNLVKWCGDGILSFSKCRTVNLDEYVGLAPDHDMSYAYFMRDNLFGKIDIDMKNVNIPSGLAADGDAECARYDAVIESMGGVDIQLLGIGNNGHIGFNEPCDHFPLGTHKVTLTESTIEANKRFFASKDDVPRYAYTMGIGPIVRARKVLLIASGSGKAEILEKSLFGKVTPEVPASILQMIPDLVVCADEAALSLILEKHPEAVER